MPRDKSRKILSGIALKDSTNKTVVVLVNFIKTHPIYRKQYKVSRKFLAHAEKEIKKGQKVSIESSRPISKNKSWKVIE